MIKNIFKYNKIKNRYQWLFMYKVSNKYALQSWFDISNSYFDYLYIWKDNSIVSSISDVNYNYCEWKIQFKFNWSLNNLKCTWNLYQTTDKNSNNYEKKIANDQTLVEGFNIYDWINNLISNWEYYDAKIKIVCEWKWSF